MQMQAASLSPHYVARGLYHWLIRNMKHERHFDPDQGFIELYPGWIRAVIWLSVFLFGFFVWPVAIMAVSWLWETPHKRRSPVSITVRIYGMP